MKIRGSSYRTERCAADTVSRLSVFKLKPFKFPEGFVLVQDTREQRPLFSRMPVGLTMKSAALKDGDYSIAGFENMFAVERKGIGDFFQYIATDRVKTTEKMERFRKMMKNGGWAGLAIEHPEKDILKPQEFTKVPPEVARAALISFEVRYGIHVYFGNRDDCGRWILDRAIKFWNIKHES